MIWLRKNLQDANPQIHYTTCVKAEGVGSKRRSIERRHNCVEVPQRVKNRSAQPPSNCTVGDLPQRYRCSEMLGPLHPNVNSSSVHNSQTMKRTEVSINRWWVDNHILLKKIQSSSLLMQKLRLNKKSFPLVLASDVLLRHHNLIQALSPNPSFP